MKIYKTNLLILFSAFSASVLLTANLSAGKLWSFFGLPVDGGIVIFPLSYIISDLVMEFFGKKTSKFIIYASFTINIIASLTFLIVSILPVFPGWEGQQSFEYVFNSAHRIIIASLIAFLISSIINVYVFEKIKQKLANKSILYRTLGSSFVARFFDIIIFETIAFLGVLPFTDFFQQIIFAYFAGIILEIALSPLTIFTNHFIKKYLKADNE